MPSSGSSFQWTQKPLGTELLATTGDSLRVWEYTDDAPLQTSNFVGRQPSGGHRLVLRASLSGVRLVLFSLSFLARTIAYYVVCVIIVKSTAEPTLRGATDQLLMERKSPKLDRHILNRHHLHRLEYRYLHSPNPAHRTRPRSLRRRLAPKFHRHLRLRRRGWLPARVRSPLPRTLHHPLRNPCTEEPSDADGAQCGIETTDEPVAEDRVQSRG